MSKISDLAKTFEQTSR
ncbi:MULTISPECIES: MbeB family mobilization protein, partial [Pseudomonadota]